jgi:hypothetical protein
MIVQLNLRWQQYGMQFPEHALEIEGCQIFVGQSVHGGPTTCDFKRKKI